MLRIIKNIAVLLLCMLAFEYSSAQTVPDPEIVSVSVDTFPNDGRVTIEWKKVDHPDFDTYILYKINDMGQPNVIGTVSNENKLTFEYTEAKADVSSRGFTMRYKYLSGDTLSLSANYHYTIFVEEGKFDGCEKTLEVTWNNYVGWEGKIDYRVYVKKNNNGYREFKTTDTVFTIKSVTLNTNYKVYVVAKSNAGVESLSNIAEIYTEPESPLNPDLFYIDAITYNGSAVQMEFNVDNSVDVLKYDIQTKNIPENDFEHLVYVESASNVRYTYTHNGVSNENPQYYRINAIGFCNDSLGTTNVAKQIIIEGFVSNNIASLIWNYCFEQFGESYTLWVDVDGAGFKEYQTGVGTRGIQIDLKELSDSEGSAEYFCFKVSARSSNNYFGESNTICFALTPEVNIPTAFTPNGDDLNETIGPTIEYADISQYLYIVYDRYGGKMFETKNYGMEWDGKAGSKNVSEGAYLYYIKFSTNQGQGYEKSGTINLIYP